MSVKEKIIGRKLEQEKLEKAFRSTKAELIAVFGRRRVGKTFLIRHFFEKKASILFQVTGIYKATSRIQLKEFTKEIRNVFFPRIATLESCKSWMDAFELLTETIKENHGKQPIVLFFDELPWMAIRSSKLLKALEYYWNRFWVNMPRIKLVVCGSTTSWIIKNIINNKGGLHNRVTLRLSIEPFSLHETKLFLAHEGIKFDNYQTLQVYLCLGGVPYYLSLLKNGLSAVQNINQLCFHPQGGLINEFSLLFSSLFTNAEAYKKIVRLISIKREGMSREEIEKTLKYKGGNLTKQLSELEQIGFISAFTPWDRAKKGAYYKIIDEYLLFYLTWIAPKTKNQAIKTLSDKYWEAASQSSAWQSWVGYAFEAICFKHINLIRKALHIPDNSIAYPWKYIPSKKEQLSFAGAQVDLVFDREDSIINLCEIKYRNTFYTLKKEDYQILLKKAQVYRDVTKTKKLIFISLITTFGLKQQTESQNLITSTATLDDLFSSN